MAAATVTTPQLVDKPGVRSAIWHYFGLKTNEHGEAINADMQFITASWEMQSWCIGCSALQSDHTADTLKEALEDVIMDSWGLDMAKMSGITTDNVTNNRKAFSNYLWIPCFGHNLHLAVKKAIEIDRVASCLSRLRKTVSGFSRSNKISRQLKDKQKSLKLPQHKLIHDEPQGFLQDFFKPWGVFARAEEVGDDDDNMNFEM